MRRAGYIVAALLLLGGIVRADQGWQDNQDGSGFDLYDAGSVSCNNLSSGGATYSTPGTGTIVNSYPSWWSQTAWFIDPQNSSGFASDSNTGLTNVTPLLTWAEMARRWNGAVLFNPAGYTITLMSDGNSSDAVSMNVQIGGNSGVSIVGIPTVIYTGTVTAYTGAGAGPAADDYEINDASIPSSFTASGLLADGLVAQQTTTANRWFFVAKDLGSKTARVTVPANASSGVGVLTNGSTYIVERLPKLYGLQWQNMYSLTTSVTRLGYNLVYDMSPDPGWQQATYSRCWRGTTTDTDIAFSFSNSAIGAGLTTNLRIGKAQANFQLGLVRSQMFIEDGEILMAGTTFQGVGIELARGSILTLAARISIYDNSSVAIATDTGAREIFTGSGNLSGSGNSGNLLSVASGGMVSYDNTPISASSTSGTPVNINSTGYSVAALPVSDPNSGSGVRQAGAPSYSAGCAQFTTSGILSSTGSSCGSGSGTVTSVTGTAQRISVVNPTTTPVVDTIGGFYSGAVSGGNEDLGTTLTNGLVCNDTTAGVAVLRSCVSGTDYQPPTAKTCTGGQFLNEIDATGATVCASPPGGTVTAVSASPPLAITGGASPTPNVIYSSIAADTLVCNPTGSSAAPTTMSLGTTSGVMEYIHGSPDTLASFAAVTNEVPYGSGTNGQFTQSTNLEFDGTSLFVGAHATGVQPSIRANDSLASFSQFSFYPGSGTNVGMAFQISPKGTGFSSTLKSQFGVYNSDNIADPTDFDVALLRAAGSQYVFGTGHGGSAADKPLMFAAGWVTNGTTNANQVLLDTNGHVDLVGLAAGGIVKAVTETPSVGPSSGNLAIATSGTDYQAPVSAGTCIVIGGGTSIDVKSGACGGTSTFGSGTTYIQDVTVDGYGKVQSAASASTLVCSLLPAVGGDLTSAGNTCSIQVIALEETAGPARLSLGAIADLGASNDNILVRPGGTGTVIGRAASAISIGMATENMKFQEFLPTGTGAGYLSTASNAAPGTAAGNPIEYPIGIVVAQARLLVSVQLNNLTSAFGCTSVTLALTRNGGAAPPSAVAVTIPLSSGTLFWDSGLISEAGTAQTDTWGVFYSINGCGVAPAGLLYFTANAEFAR